MKKINLFYKFFISVIFCSFCFLIGLYFTDFPASTEFFILTLEGFFFILWVLVPLLAVVSSIVVFIDSEKRILLYVKSIGSVLLMSNMTLYFIVHVNPDFGFGIVFVAFNVWGSTILFLLVLLIRTLVNYFFKQDGKILFYFNEEKIKVLKAFVATTILFFILLQVFFMASAIVAYKATKELDLKIKSQYSVYYFYRPTVREIRLSNGMRWSYSRVKFMQK